MLENLAKAPNMAPESHRSGIKIPRSSANLFAFEALNGRQWKREGASLVEPSQRRRSEMRASLTKVVAVSLTALTLGVATVGAATPAFAAQMWHGHGGGGGGGWHG